MQPPSQGKLLDTFALKQQWAVDSSCKQSIVRPSRAMTSSVSRTYSFVCAYTSTPIPYLSSKDPLSLR